MGIIKSFRDLDTWQVGMRLVEGVYETSAAFPDTERYGLIAQIRRAAVSIPSNVAEGQATRGSPWSLKHVRIAIGSLAEVETQLELAFRLGFAARSSSERLLATIDDTRRHLYGRYTEFPSNVLPRQTQPRTA